MACVCLHAPPMSPQTTLKQALTKVHHRMLLATLAK